MIALVLLLVGTLLATYVLIGYPLLLAAGRRQGPPVAKSFDHQPTVTVLLAIHNGAKFVQQKLDTLFALNYPGDRVKIIVVSDGSTDETESIIEQYSHRVTLIRLARVGKAAALNAGLPQASGEIVFFTDVRQPLEKDALRHLAANFADPTVGAVTGELRMLNPQRQGEQADLDLYWRYELWARGRQAAIDSVFNTTGCIYAMRRSLIEPIAPDTLTDDAMIPLQAFFKGYRVIFDPAAIAYDYPTVEGGEFRRRMRTLAGLWQVHARLPQLFSSRNRMRWHFLSHKFGRLALPWAILLTVAGTWLLPDSPIRSSLLWSEVALVALALVDRWVPKGFPLKRLSSAARTFCAMNVAALAAIAVFVVPPAKLWKTTTSVERRS